MRQIVTRDDYFEAAMALLAEGGSGALKVSTLCNRLNVTSGSFYGYFGRIETFIDEFLSYWQQTQTDRIVALVAVPDEPRQRLLRITEQARSLPHQAEAAIRSWANTSRIVATTQDIVDNRRLRALYELLEPITVSPQEAHALATMAMTLLIGVQQWCDPCLETDFDEVFRSFGALVLGKLGMDPGPEFS